MFAVDHGHRLIRLKRKPSYWLDLVAEGWLFLPENRLWDADERTAVSVASELAALGAFIGQHEPDRWWKAYAGNYVRLRDPVAAYIASQDAPAVRVCPDLASTEPKPRLTVLAVLRRAFSFN